MVTTIPIVGIASNDPVPGNLVSVQFAQGVASSGQTDYSAILIGNRLSTGFALDDGYVYGSSTPDVVDSEQDVINAFGAGSELHRMWRRFRAVNSSQSLFMICVKESTGNQASGTITFTGTATGSGTARVFVCGEQIDTGIVTGDTPTTICTNIALSINGLPRLGITATGGTGTLTLTAKQKGLRGNQIRYSCKILPGVGSGVTVSPSVSTLMTGGTVADSNVNALATIANQRYYYYVSAAEDATQLGNISAQLDSAAAPTVGLRQRCVAGSNISSLSATQTIAIGINDPRVELVFQSESDWTAAELAANAAACYTLFEQALGAQSSLNFNGFGNDATTASFWRVKAPVSGANLSRAQLKTALSNGVTPIVSNTNGSTYLVRRITTRSLLGANPDYRVRDCCKVTVSDKFADDLLSQANTRFAGRTIGNDPIKGQLPPGSNVVTPGRFQSMVVELLNQYFNAGLIQDLDNTIAGVVVVRESSPTTRISCRIPLKVVDIFNSSGTEVDEVSQG